MLRRLAAFLPGICAADRHGSRQVSEANREFINKAAMSGQAEVASGETAAKSENSAIADFGNQMVREHGAMNQEFAALAKQKGVEPPTSASLTD
jgi:putative membrane protein